MIVSISVSVGTKDKICEIIETNRPRIKPDVAAKFVKRVFFYPDTLDVGSKMIDGVGRGQGGRERSEWPKRRLPELKSDRLGADRLWIPCSWTRAIMNFRYRADECANVTFRALSVRQIVFVIFLNK